MPANSDLAQLFGGSYYSQAVMWYETFERDLGWKNLGEVLGAGKTPAAFELGASTK